MRKVLLVLIGTLLATLGLGLMPATASAQPYTSTDAAFVAALADEGIIYRDGGRAVVSLGHDIASTLRQSPTLATMDAIVTAGISAGIDPYDVGTIIGTAVTYYAPEIIPLAIRWAKQQIAPITSLR